MLLFLARRLLAAIPILAGVLVFTFVLMRVLPGDPAAYLAGTPGVGPDEIARIRADIGTDKPILVQLLIYVRALASGHLGTSIVTGRPVIDELARRLPASLELTGFALILTLLLALPAGIAAALRRGGLIDQAVRVASAIGGAIPSFVTGLLLVFLFFYLLGWAPEPVGRIDTFVDPPARITGFYLIDSVLGRNREQFVASLRQILLPALTMVAFAAPPIARMTRAAMLDALGSEPIRTANALGLPRRRIIVTYALGNAAIAIVSTVGTVIAFMLGANVLVEKVFGWPGIGTYALEGLLASDYAPVQGFVLAMSGIFIGVNFAIDVIYAAVDPRARARS